MSGFLKSGTGIPPTAHAGSHEDTGGDEIDVTGLDGVLLDPQNASKLQGRNVSPAAPADKYGLSWNSSLSQWEPRDVSVDLDAYAQKSLLDAYMVDTDLTIYAEKSLLDGYIVAPASATDGYALVWNAAASKWSPQIQDGYWLQGEPLPTKTANRFLKRNAGNTGWEEVPYGTASNTVCEGNDSRLSDSRAPSGAASGDLSGTYPGPTVSKVQNRAFSPAAPLDGYVAVWNSAASTWSPQTQDGYLLQKRKVSSAAPSNAQALVWNASANQWEPGTPGGVTATGLVAPVPTLTALGLLPTSGLAEGSLAYVNNVDDIYYLERGKTLTPDGYDVIAGYNDGYWVSRFQGRWNDMLGDISQGVGTGTLQYDPFRDTPWRLYCMRYDQSEELNFRFQIDHTWRYDLPVVPHLHVLPLADPAGAEVAYFDAYYTWSRANYTQAVPARSGWTWLKISVTINPGDVYKEKIVSLGAVTPPSWARESSVLLLYVRRLGTDPLDTYNTNKDHGLAQANLGLLSADVHFRRNKFGTLPELPP